MTAPDTAAQAVMVAVLITILIACLIGMGVELAKDTRRRRAAAFNRHTDQAIEVTR